MSTEQILEDTKTRMKKSMEALHKELAVIRTGRAHSSLLDQVKINIYGQNMPLSNAASVTTTDSKTLSISVWDPNNVKAVDTAIRQANLNLNPRIDGNKLFVVIPSLTAERREELIKVAKKKGEETKISMRNIRREANDELKKLEKDKSITEDELKACLDTSQKITDQYIGEVSHSVDIKQKDLETI